MPIPLKEIDPFTFLSYLNKYGDLKRLEILNALHDILHLKSDKPVDVDGLPTINAMKVWLFGFSNIRKQDDIDNLWALFHQAVDHTIEERTFQKVLNIRCVGKGKLSICLFYTDPEFYLTLDTRTSVFLKDKGLRYSYRSYADYIGLINGAVNKLDISRCEISKKAWEWYRSKKQAPVKVDIQENDELYGELLPITSLTSLIDFIEDVKDKSEFRGEVYYRGHASHEFELEPGIYRKDNPNHIKREDVMFKEIIGKVPAEFQSCTSSFERMVKMQHYGLPTRLLDITSNPLVALYFACSEFKDKKNGILYRFEIENSNIKYYDSDTVSVLSNIARRPYTFAVDSKYTFANNDPNRTTHEIKIEFNECEAIVYLLHEIGTEKPHFKPLIEIGDIFKTICVKPKLDNPRIIRQDGAFFLFGIDGDKSKCAPSPRPTQVFVIPKNKKEEILQQLDAIGINEFSLFPDIDHSTKYIKAKFARD